MVCQTVWVCRVQYPLAAVVTMCVPLYLYGLLSPAATSKEMFNTLRVLFGRMNRS
jgi:hypothetical protein